MLQVHSFVFSPFSENTYVVYDETNEAVIIDPGCLTQAEKTALSDFISSKNLTVKSLLQTHAHLDHVFGSAFVKRKYGVKMHLHKNELPILSEVENRCKIWGIPGYEPVEADIMIDEGDVISFGNSKLAIRFCVSTFLRHIFF